MIFKNARFLISILLALTLVACGGGGGDDDSPLDLSSNACSVLGLNPKIINGTACTGNSPVVPITTLNADGTVGLCSGTMITDNDVLTAAHCFLLVPVASAFIEANGQQIFADLVTTHPGVQLNPAAGEANNDVAVLRLVSSPGLPTVPLALSNDVDSGDTISIFGYGLDDNGQTDVLRSGEMLVVDVDRNHISSIYTGDGSNTCNGDSGGPALFTFSKNGTTVTGIAGVVSSGTDAACSVGDISRFTNVQSEGIVDFLTQTVPDLGAV